MQRRVGRPVLLGLMTITLLWGPDNVQGQTTRRAVLPQGTAPPPGSFVVVLDSPTEQQRARNEVATLRIRRRGTGMGAARFKTWVRVGDRVTVLKRGELRAVALGAHPTQLQRLRIAGHTVLLHVPPGANLTLSDNPCFGWELSGPGLDPNSVKGPDAVCVAQTADCPEGFMVSPAPRLADDPLCPPALKASDRFKRCIRAAVVHWDRVSQQHTVKQRRTGDTEWKPLTRNWTVVPGGCGFAAVDTGVERALLAIGVGQRWHLRVEAEGLVRGETQPDRGEILVRTTPPAKVYLDGKARGKSPLLLRSVPAGRHLLRLTWAGYGVWERWVEVKGGHRLEVDVTHGPKSRVAMKYVKL